jgi:hypothetical protein
MTEHSVKLAVDIFDGIWQQADQAELSRSSSVNAVPLFMLGLFNTSMPRNGIFVIS